MDLSERRVDISRASDGVWVSGIAGWGDLKIKVRGMSSPAYRDAAARLAKAIPPEDRNSDRSISTDREDRLLGETLAEAGLLDWQNVTSGGEAVLYSKEKARELLTDPAYFEFREVVAAHVARVGVIRESEDLDRLGK